MSQIPSVPESIGPVRGFYNRVRLILLLMGDPRVNPLIKLIPIGAVLYFIIPDLIPGPIDDAIAIWLGTVVFVELSPPEVVEEHMQALEGDVVEGRYREVGDDE